MASACASDGRREGRWKGSVGAEAVAVAASAGGGQRSEVI
jgi:hypothetical protein